MNQAFNYTNLVCLVIDEADEVLNNTTFAQDIVSVTKMFRGLHLPVQILLFSATFDEKVLRFTRQDRSGSGADSEGTGGAEAGPRCIW